MRDDHGVSRRRVLGLAIAAGGFAVSGAVSSVFAQALNRTPGEILGPFYPVLRSVEKTADLTSLPGKQRRTDATPTRVTRTRHPLIPTSRASPFRIPMPRAVIGLRRSSQGRIRLRPTG